MKKIILMLIPLIATGCVSICVTKSKYEYTDLFGNKGTSNNCYENSRGGSLTCENGEDSKIQVAEYKLISEEETCE